MTHNAKVDQDNGTPNCRLAWFRVTCACGFQSGYMIGKVEAIARAAIHNMRPEWDDVRPVARKAD